MKGTIRTLLFVFSMIGFVFLSIGVVKLTNTIIFLQDAVKTQAIILGHVKGEQFRPVIAFSDQSGKSHTFRSSFSSKSLYKNLHESQITIFYNPNNPNEVRFDKFVDLWSGPLFCFIFALGFSLFPIFIAAVTFCQYRRKAKLLKNGYCVQAKIESINKNTYVIINNISPWVITCSWKNNQHNDSKNYKFISDDIWFNPKPFIRSHSLSVYFHPKDPDYYYVDIRFLPKSQN